MKSKTLLVLASLMMLATGTAWGQTDSMTLDAVNTISPGVVDTGTAITFSIRMMNNSGSAITGSTNGFRVYSLDGATWVTTTGAFTGTITAGMFDAGTFVNPFSDDGIGADTIGFGGFSLFGTGIQTGFNDTVWTITVGPIPSAHVGKTICLDSSYYPPAGIWKWSTDGGDVLPSWDGPHCFTIVGGGGGDQPPVQAFIGSKSVAECDSLGFQVTATDPQAYALTMTAVNLPAGATYTDNTNGTADFSWKTVAADAGVYNVSFITTAATSNMADTEIVTITVTANNSPVLTTIGAQAVTQCAQLTINIVATDADGDVMAIDTLNGPTGGVLTNTGNGTATYTWTPGATNIDTTVTIIVNDDCGGTTSETVAITVNPASAPVFAVMNDTSIAECMALTLNVSATNTQTLSDSGITGAVFTDNGGGSGTFVWTPPNGASTDTVVFTASSSCGSPVKDTVIITVTANVAPALTAIGAQSVIQCAQLSFNVTATDTEGGIMTITATNGPTGGSFVDSGNGTGTYTWQTASTNTDSSVFITVTDDCGNSDTQTVAITVTANVAPALTAIGAQSATECVALVISLSATDPEGGALAFDTANAPTSGVVFVDSGNGAGSFTWTPPNGAGSPTVTFKVTDDCGNVRSEVVVITVGGNVAPALTAIGAQTVIQCAQLSFNVTATDTEGGTMTITATNGPTDGVLTNTGNGTGTYTWQTASTNTDSSVFITVTDDCGNSDTQTVAITVTPNVAPALTAIGAKTVVQCAQLSFAIAATDTEAGTMIIAATNGPGGILTDSGNGAGTYTWTPTNSDTDTSVTITVTDDCGKSVSEVVAITVTPNAPPVFDTTAAISTVSFTQRDTTSVLIFATDADTGSSLTIWVDTTTVPVGEDFSVDSTGVDSVTFTWRSTTGTPGGQHLISFMVSDGCSVDTLVVTYDVTLGVTTVAGSEVPDHFFLAQNYPNPFNPETQIEFGIAERTHVKLAIYNVLGQQIRMLIDESLAPNMYITDWDGTSDAGVYVATGIYFYRIETDLFQQTMKMVLMK